MNGRHVVGMPWRVAAQMLRQLSIRRDGSVVLERTRAFGSAFQKHLRIRASARARRGAEATLLARPPSLNSSLMDWKAGKYGTTLETFRR